MTRDKVLTRYELLKIYRVLKAVDEGLVSNPSEGWELDYYDVPLLNKSVLKPILSKIEKLLPKEDYSEVKKEVLRRRYDTFNNSVDSSIYSKLSKALSNKKRVEIEYFGMEAGKASKRAIDIYYINSKYIIAYCHLRKAIRKFRVSRVVKAKLLEESYTVPSGFDKSEYL